ncbi:hypothetical protein DL768_011399 [Monosporascus sp. mg162]|nr:hypothetical protein DL768_011399 [Monosporascus sp. mg162]
MTNTEPEKGDKVSWKWGSGAPEGTVAERKDEGEIAIKTQRGNMVKKNADPDNPAVRIERSGNDVVKRASELTVEQKASGNKEGQGEAQGGRHKVEGEAGDDDAKGQTEGEAEVTKEYGATKDATGNNNDARRAGDGTADSKQSSTNKKNNAESKSNGGTSMAETRLSPKKRGV